MTSAVDTDLGDRTAAAAEVGHALGRHARPSVYARGRGAVLVSTLSGSFSTPRDFEDWHFPFDFDTVLLYSMRTEECSIFAEQQVASPQCSLQRNYLNWSSEMRSVAALPEQRRYRRSRRNEASCCWFRSPRSGRRGPHPIFALQLIQRHQCTRPETGHSDGRVRAKGTAAKTQPTASRCDHARRTRGPGLELEFHQLDLRYGAAPCATALRALADG